MQLGFQPLALVRGCLAGLFAFAVFVFAVLALAEAAEPVACPRWHITETENLRILNYGTEPIGRETADACEAARNGLAKRWLKSDQTHAWRPKCDIVLHSTDGGYLREVGAGARSTAASALVEQREGRVVLRRVDVRATRKDWLSSALAHELTHVVLADRFRTDALPRWLDEGIAILADPAAKRAGHAQGVRRAMASGSHFRLVELLALRDYPPAGRWGAFYDQSAALVEFLVAEAGPTRFVEFVEQALENGYPAALSQVYGQDLGELERTFHAALAKSGRQSPRTSHLAKAGT